MKVVKTISSLFILAAGLAFLGVGCGAEQPAKSIVPMIKASSGSDSCSVGTIAIGVGDGFLEIICGCVGENEVSGTIFSPPGNLICHARPGTNTVGFYFLGTTLTHQIISTGNPSFGLTPVSNPQETSPLRIYPAPLSQGSGTYNFQDAVSGLTGQILVP